MSAGTDRPFEPPRDLGEDHVAGLVAEAVVDRLEVVEVDEHDRDQRAAADGRTEGVRDAVGEERAVGEVGDRIVERLMRELVLEGLALADVAAVEDDPADVLVLRAVGVLHLELQPATVAVPERAVERVRLRVGGAAAVDDRRAGASGRPRRARRSKRCALDSSTA